MAEVAAAGTFLCSRDAKFITGMYTVSQKISKKFVKFSVKSFLWKSWNWFHGKGIETTIWWNIGIIFWRVRFEFIMENIQKRNFPSFFFCPDFLKFTGSTMI